VIEEVWRDVLIPVLCRSLEREIHGVQRPIHSNRLR